MAFNKTNEIIISIHKDDPEAFYAKIPYDKLDKIHRVGGKWIQSGKEWRFPLDDDIWEKFQKEFKEEFNNNLVKKDLSFILAFEKRRNELKKFNEFKQIAIRDEPVEFAVDGISLNGKNCLFNYQKWGIKCGLQVGDGFLIGDVPGLGKCEIVDNKLFTPFGRKRIGDIIVGDKVIGSDGDAHNVIGVYPQGIKHVYKITFNDGYSIECGEEHLWTVFDGNETKTLMTKEIKELSYTNFQIPIVKPIQFINDDELPIEPYLMGTLISNGNYIDNSDFDEIYGKYIERNYLGARELTKGLKKVRIIQFDDITEENQLNKLKLNVKASERFIPDCYKYTSINNRLKLLYGLMDTDGFCTPCHTEFKTSSEKLADDMVELIQSLGGIAIKYFIDDFYHLNIKMPRPFNPFRLSRKHDAYHFVLKHELSRYIKNISYVGEKECVCIAVDAPDHLYVTEHAIVTHNTIQAMGIAKERMNRGEIKNCLIVCPASLKYNWKEEIKKFANMEALVIGHKCKNKEEREKHWIAEGYSFKIVNYELVARDLYCEPKKTDNRISCANAVLKSYDMVVFDECQYLKHHSSTRTKACRALQAKYRIGLTGTPLDGRLEEIHSIFQILKPGLFVSKQKFMERYAEYDYFGAVKGYHHIKEVADKISPYYLRRKKEEVLKDLPPKLFKDMHVELSAKNMKAYKDLVKKKNDITENASAAELLIRARQFLDFPEILGIHNSSDKYAVFKELIDDLVKENGQKVVVFSQYTNTIHWLVKNLEQEYKGIQVIDGSIKSEERQKICKKFNNDPNYNILIMSDAGAEGLNLQSGSAVIHYTDSFSPAKQQQRNDRCHRATTRHSVTIYRFVTDGTIEEHVRGILARKMAVNNALLGEDCDEFSVAGMSALELLSCL